MVGYAMSVLHTTTAIRIPTALYQRLAQHNVKERRSISHTVARALEMYLAMKDVDAQEKKP
jgi:predicted DNA-binding protein